MIANVSFRYFNLHLFANTTQHLNLNLNADTLRLVRNHSQISTRSLRTPCILDGQRSLMLFLYGRWLRSDKP